ncbi:hypothetical protein [Nocardia salmonicida]
MFEQEDRTVDEFVQAGEDEVRAAEETVRAVAADKFVELLR